MKRDSLYLLSTYPGPIFIINAGIIYDIIKFMIQESYL